MTKPMRPTDFIPLAPAFAAAVGEGLPTVIDQVAAIAPASHQFLRRQWFAAAIRTYAPARAGQAKTITVAIDGAPVIALPMIGMGPKLLGLAAIPGCYWPFRSFPAGADLPGRAFKLLVDRLADSVNALRIGPVYDDDPSAIRLISAARARGWAVLDRFIADSFVLDMAAEAAQGWPRNSTLRKNRFHEKHLAERGTLDWRYLDGAALAAGGFDDLADIERLSWIVARTDGRDAKFTATGHGAFWRAAAEDIELARMLHAALLYVDGQPAAFSFDINAGALKYAIANSYDPAFAKHSPGKLLYYRNLVAAMAAGIARVDWGAGDSGYKSVIGATKGPAIRDWLLLRPGMPAMMGGLLRRRWARSGQ